MKKSPSPRHISGSNIEQDLLTQLGGSIDLGMKEESLRLAAAIIESPKPKPEEIDEALRAIGIFADRMKSWMPRIDKMLSRISKRTRNKCRDMLILYFATVKEYERAASFIIAPNKLSPDSFYYAMESLVELRRFDEAKKLAHKHSWYKSEPPPNDYVDEAIAVSAGIEGEFHRAFLTRIWCPANTPLARDIFLGTIESGLALLIQNLDVRLEELKGKKKFASSDSTQLIIPGNEDKVLSDEEKFCIRWRAQLLKLIPKSRRFRYRLDS